MRKRSVARLVGWSWLVGWRWWLGEVVGGWLVSRRAGCMQRR